MFCRKRSGLLSVSGESNDPRDMSYTVKNISSVTHTFDEDRFKVSPSFPQAVSEILSDADGDLCVICAMDDEGRRREWLLSICL